jgi:MYXO-CTERM domain-containing protein
VIAELARVTVTEEEAAVSLPVSDGDRIHAVVLNTQREGESLRPALCLGMSADVRACRAELGGEQPDASSSRDAGAVSDPEDDAAAASGGCTTASTRQPRRPPAWSWLVLLAAALLYARRAHFNGNIRSAQPLVSSTARVDRSAPSS